MSILRTPDECFSSLKDYQFAPNYVVIDDLRLHYIDENPRGRIFIARLFRFWQSKDTE
jgi:hypothetical protein